MSYQLSIIALLLCACSFVEQLTCSNDFPCSGSNKCINGICIKLSTWNNGDPNCQHESAPKGPETVQKGQKMYKGKWYDCYEVIPMVRWICPKCGMMGTDLRDESKPIRWEGSECQEYMRDICQKEGIL